MKQHLETRNKVLRLRYQEYKRSRMQVDEILQTLKREFSAYGLTRETILQICTNPNYGKTKWGIWVVRSSNPSGEWLVCDGKPFQAVSQAKAENTGKKLMKKFMESVADVTQWIAKEME